MAIPSSEQEVIDSARADVQDALPESNPFLRGSMLGAMVTSFAMRIYDFYRQLTELTKQLFADTATGDFLERLGGFVGVTRNPASSSSGNAVATGAVGSLIPLSTLIRSSDGLDYVSTAAASIAANSISVSLLERVGSVVTATTSSSHNLGSGLDVTISGAVETDYNGIFTVTATSATTFTYTITGTPTTPATGTILAAYNTAVVPVSSQDTGSGTNQDNGAGITLSETIPGVNDVLIVSYDGLTGGTDIEDDNDFRGRILFAWANPVAEFNDASIIRQAREVPGVTRVFVQQTTPLVGQVTVYFMRDDDDPSIPSAGEVTTVKDKILEIKPAHTLDDDVIVNDTLTAVETDFTFTSYAPNTASMLAAIEANLDQYFKESTIPETDVTQVAYNSIIFQTVDTTTGDKVTAFVLAAPVGDITVTTGEIATLGTVS